MAIDNQRMMAAVKKAKQKTDRLKAIQSTQKVTPLPKILYRFQKVNNGTGR